MESSLPDLLAAVTEERVLTPEVFSDIDCDEIDRVDSWWLGIRSAGPESARNCQLVVSGRSGFEPSNRDRILPAETFPSPSD